jgi:hypothetical protein
MPLNNMLERALNQPTRSKKSIKCETAELIKFHELQIRRLRAIRTLSEWVENLSIDRGMFGIDKVRIARYTKAAKKLRDLYFYSVI